LDINGSITISGGSGIQNLSDAGAMASIDLINAGNSLTYIGPGTIVTNQVATNFLTSTNYSPGTAPFSSAGTYIDLAGSTITTKNFAVDSSGDAYISGSINANSGNFNGYMTVAGGTMKFGKDAGGIGTHGLKINDHNYWYSTGTDFKVGDADKYLLWNGTALAVKGEINATSGTFTGFVGAGGSKFGVGAGGVGNDGLFINSTNYWYTNGTARFSGDLTGASGTFGAVVINSSGITVSGDLAGIYLGAGRGIWTDAGGRISLGSAPGVQTYIFQSGVSGENSEGNTSLTSNSLSINRGGGTSAALQIFASGGSGDVITAYGNGMVDMEATQFRFAKRTLQTHVDFNVPNLQLDPASPGTNYVVKSVVSSGRFFMSTSTRRRKDILGRWRDGGVLNNIKNVPVERFKYKHWTYTDPETFGLIAEDLHDNGFGQAVTYDNNEDGTPAYKIPAGIDWEKVSSILWKGMQELTKRVEDLEAIISGSK
jgi:hypothetical protein